MKTLIALLVAPLLCLGTVEDVAPSAVDPVEITEWDVPWENSRPRDPYVDGQGRVWFVGQRSDYAAYLDPESGEFKRYELGAGAGPHNLIVDMDGTVWVAGNRAAYIGKLDPETGDLTKIDMPDPAARDPHTLIFDNQGDIWFTVQGGNFVGKLTKAASDVELIEVPTEGARPYGIVVDAEDRPWIALFGTNKLATVDPATMTLQEITLPDNTRPRRLQVTSDGNVWYVDYAGGKLGRYNPADETIEEWDMPGGSDSRPYGMAMDDQDRLWFVESGMDPNRLVGFDPATNEFFSTTEIESGGGTVRHMMFHAPTRTIWFGTDTNTIGRAAIP